MPAPWTRPRATRLCARAGDWPLLTLHNRCPAERYRMGTSVSLGVQENIFTLYSLTSSGRGECRDSKETHLMLSVGHPPKKVRGMWVTAAGLGSSAMALRQTSDADVIGTEGVHYMTARTKPLTCGGPAVDKRADILSLHARPNASTRPCMLHASLLRFCSALGLMRR